MKNDSLGIWETFVPKLVEPVGFAYLENRRAAAPFGIQFAEWFVHPQIRLPNDLFIRKSD